MWRLPKLFERFVEPNFEIPGVKTRSSLWDRAREWKSRTNQEIDSDSDKEHGTTNNRTS